jgi:hypothetical protein
MVGSLVFVVPSEYLILKWAKARRHGRAKSKILVELSL